MKRLLKVPALRRSCVAAVHRRGYVSGTIVSPKLHGQAVSGPLHRLCPRGKPAVAVFETLQGLKSEPIEDRGAPDVPFYFVDEFANPVSPWHDIPARQGFGLSNTRALTEAPEEAAFNFVCEIPRGTTAKYEISTEQQYNPIRFDRTKDGRPR
jgi:hypothetical protein